HSAHYDRLARLVDRVGAESRGGSAHGCCVFLGRALETVVHLKLWNGRIDDDLHGLPIGVEYKDAFRIWPEDLLLFAIRRGAVTRNNVPSSDNLLFERFLLSGGRHSRQR